MFSDLRDSISLVFYWQWPRIEGEITAVRVVSGSGKLLLDYSFSVGDESYTGEDACPFWYAGSRAINVSKKFPIGEPVTVRYRRDNPSVNRLDRSVWQDLEGL